jgi:hypothetical protein
MFYIIHLYLVEIDKRKIKFDFIFRLICLFDGVWRHFQQYFCCIISVSFIGWVNRRTRRKPPWSFGSWIYNYLCNQYLSPLMLRVRISIKARCTKWCDKVCQCLVTGRWFSPGPPVSSTNKTDRYDTTEILLKVASNTIKQTN